MAEAALHGAGYREVVYNEAIVKKFIIAAMFWGVVAFLVGVYIATELAWPELNFGLSFLNFGRLRPVHTSAAIFAFGGYALFGTSFYVVQRTCRARLFGGDALANFLFWGYKFFIVMAALSYVLGFSQGQEYAEPEWHLDLWLAVVWVAYAVVFIGTVAEARGAAHLRRQLVLPGVHPDHRGAAYRQQHRAAGVSFFGAKSYRSPRGVQNALIQWWYGHNAVGFFLTAGFLGMMYYFIPKAANRPVYSYRLSIVHFWSLIFMYIWAGPHHLHWTALPDWAQTLGMAFSIMLWMPSWGGMINGLMTLSGAWDKLRTDPGLRFSVTAVGFYGMSTFEGPVMSIRDGQRAEPLHRLGHRPRAFRRARLGGVHQLRRDLLPGAGAVEADRAVFDRAGRLALLDRDARHRASTSPRCGWPASCKGLMWRAYDQSASCNTRSSNRVVAVHPFYVIRMLGGVMFLIGALLMVYNLIMTVRSPTRPRVRRRSCRPASPWRGSKHHVVPSRHHREERLPAAGADAGHRGDRRHRRNRAAVHHRNHGGAREGRAPLLAAGTAGRDIYVREGCYSATAS